MSKYIIKRVLNNNSAIINLNGVETLVYGLAIGFKRNKGDFIHDYEIEKRFTLRDDDEKYQIERIIEKIPEEYLSFSSEIVEYISTAVNEELNENLFITITDHIYSSIDRYHNGIELKNLMLWEIKSFFKKEYEIGLYVIDRIFDKFNIKMKDDEAAFIALHIINANFDESTPIASKITRFIESLIKQFEKNTKLEFDVNSISYFRFVTHLKYLAQRVFIHKQDSAENISDSELLDILKTKYSVAYENMKYISKWIYRTYDYTLEKSDQLYLTIHISKMLENTKEGEADKGC